MTVAYDTFEAALLAWLPAATGVGRAYWENRQRNEERAKHWGLLNVIAERRLGIDDRRYEFDSGAPAGSDMEATIAGQRVITVSVRVKSRSQKPLETARHFLSKAATSLRMPSVLEVFAAADIAIVSIGDFVNLDFTQQNRTVSLGSMDVLFATVVNEVDPVKISFIEKLELTSDFKNAAGVSLPASLQLVDAEVP